MPPMPKFKDTLYLYPSEILFLQDSIKPTFRNGRSLRSTVFDFIGGRETLGDGYALSVISHKGRYWTLNNRSLWVFRRLETTGVCRRIKVRNVPKNRINWWQYFTTKTNGRTVQLRKDLEIPPNALEQLDKNDDGFGGFEHVDMGVISRALHCRRHVSQGEDSDSDGPWEGSGRKVEMFDTSTGTPRKGRRRSRSNESASGSHRPLFNLSSSLDRHCRSPSPFHLHENVRGDNFDFRNDYFSAESISKSGGGPRNPSPDWFFHRTTDNTSFYSPGKLEKDMQQRRRDSRSLSRSLSPADFPDSYIKRAADTSFWPHRRQRQRSTSPGPIKRQRLSPNGRRSDLKRTRLCGSRASRSLSPDNTKMRSPSASSSARRHGRLFPRNPEGGSNRRRDSRSLSRSVSPADFPDRYTAHHHFSPDWRQRRRSTSPIKRHRLSPHGRKCDLKHTKLWRSPASRSLSPDNSKIMRSPSASSLSRRHGRQFPRSPEGGSNRRRDSRSLSRSRSPADFPDRYTRKADDPHLSPDWRQQRRSTSQSPIKHQRHSPNGRQSDLKHTRLCGSRASRSLHVSPDNTKMRSPSPSARRHARQVSRSPEGGSRKPKDTKKTKRRSPSIWECDRNCSCSSIRQDEDTSHSEQVMNEVYALARHQSHCGYRSRSPVRYQELSRKCSLENKHPSSLSSWEQEHGKHSKRSPVSQRISKSKQSRKRTHSEISRSPSLDKFHKDLRRDRKTSISSSVKSEKNFPARKRCCRSRSPSLVKSRVNQRRERHRSPSPLVSLKDPPSSNSSLPSLRAQLDDFWSKCSTFVKSERKSRKRKHKKLHSPDGLRSQCGSRSPTPKKNHRKSKKKKSRRKQSCESMSPTKPLRDLSTTVAIQQSSDEQTRKCKKMKSSRSRRPVSLSQPQRELSPASIIQQSLEVKTRKGPCQTQGELQNVSDRPYKTTDWTIDEKSIAGYRGQTQRKQVWDRLGQSVNVTTVDPSHTQKESLQSARGDSILGRTYPWLQQRSRGWQPHISPVSVTTRDTANLVYDDVEDGCWDDVAATEKTTTQCPEEDFTHNHSIQNKENCVSGSESLTSCEVTFKVTQLVRTKLSADCEHGHFGLNTEYENYWNCLQNRFTILPRENVNEKNIPGTGSSRSDTRTVLVRDPSSLCPSTDLKDTKSNQISVPLDLGPPKQCAQFLLKNAPSALVQNIFGCLSNPEFCFFSHMALLAATTRCLQCQWLSASPFAFQYPSQGFQNLKPSPFYSVDKGSQSATISAFDNSNDPQKKGHERKSRSTETTTLVEERPNTCTLGTALSDSVQGSTENTNAIQLAQPDQDEAENQTPDNCEQTTQDMERTTEDNKIMPSVPPLNFAPMPIQTVESRRSDYLNSLVPRQPQLSSGTPFFSDAAFLPTLVWPIPVLVSDSDTSQRWDANWSSPSRYSATHRIYCGHPPRRLE